MVHDHAEHALGPVLGDSEGLRGIVNREPMGDQHPDELGPGRQHVGGVSEVAPAVMAAVPERRPQSDLLQERPCMGHRMSP